MYCNGVNSVKNFVSVLLTDTPVWIRYKPIVLNLAVSFSWCTVGLTYLYFYSVFLHTTRTISGKDYFLVFIWRNLLLRTSVGCKKPTGSHRFQLVNTSLDYSTVAISTILLERHKKIASASYGDWRWKVNILRQPEPKKVIC